MRQVDKSFKINDLTKRIFDIVFSILALLLLGWAIFIGFLIASIDTKANGLFRQIRIGQYGRKFKILKLRTIHPATGHISATGQFFRKYKIDEFPQLFNVLLGEMSFVGPRPDIPGYYDALEGNDRKVLELRPGITSAASLKYAQEDLLLLQQENPEAYNDTVIFPDKVKMNLDYYRNRSFFGDIKIILETIFRK